MKSIKNAHSVSVIGYHIIWCTKYRKEILYNQVEVELKHIIGEVCIEYGWKPRSLEVMPDHVHLFIQCDHLTRPVDISSTLKSISAVRIFTLFPKLKGRAFWGSGLWSRGTYYSTVGHISEDVIVKYIETQKKQ